VPDSYVNRLREDLVTMNLLGEMDPPTLYNVCISSDDPRLQSFASRVREAEPETLIGLIREENVLIADLVAAWQLYHHNLGLIKQARRIPDVYESVFDSAVGREEPCDRCDGEGTVEKHGEEVLCKKCKGTGRLQAKPSPEAQKLVAENTGFKKVQPLMNVNQDNRRQAISISESSSVVGRILATTLPKEVESPSSEGLLALPEGANSPPQEHKADE
jgi:hypothetical protein